MTRATTLPTLASAGCLLLAACASPTAPERPPVLSVPVVHLGAVSRFIPFGAALPGSGVLNPAYELLVTDTAAEVRAVTAGVIARVIANTQGDYELHVSVPGAPSYLVIYDHVQDLQVGAGQSVQPGTVLGRVGVWSDTHGRIELQINHGQLSVCPRELGTPEFNAAHEAALAAADPASQHPSWTSVCLADTVVP
jgi:hypothetical protein